MGDTPARGAAAEGLAEYVLGGGLDEPSAAELARWLADSSRFRAFVQAHRDKIRKKLRHARDAGARLDVRAELRVACLLLADRHVELAFESYGSGQAGPDFTVAFRGERPFNVEVTRLRRPPGEAGFWPLLAKLHQLPPGVPNALLVAIDGANAEALDVAAAARALRARADAKDEDFFAVRGFEGTRGFYGRFVRLGAVLVWSETAEGDGRAALWTNRSARIAVPVRGVRACLACLRADG